MKSPWARFPVFLSGQIGYMASPAWLAAAADDTALEAKPVGTGPFVFKSYEVGGSFVATKNPDYWRKDEGLPYLDQIEYRVLADGQARKNALLSGEIDIMHTSAGLVIDDLRKEDSIELTETSAFGETNYVLMNVDNPESPLNDVRIRKALAMAIDNQVLIDRRGAGIGEVANGPFSPDQIGYLDETGYPEVRPGGRQGARRRVQGRQGRRARSTSPTRPRPIPANLETARAAQAVLGPGRPQRPAGPDRAGPVHRHRPHRRLRDVRLAQPRWRRSRQPADLVAQRDRRRARRHSALNFGRIKDDVIDENLDKLRPTNDEDEIKAAAEAINKQFGEQVYNLWNSWTVWGIAKKPSGQRPRLLRPARRQQRDLRQRHRWLPPGVAAVDRASQPQRPVDPSVLSRKRTAS